MVIYVSSLPHCDMNKKIKNSVYNLELNNSNVVFEINFIPIVRFYEHNII